MVQKHCTNLCAKSQKIIIFHLTSDLNKVQNSAVQCEIVFKYLVICSWKLHSLFISTVFMDGNGGNVFKKCIYLANRWWVWTRSISSTLPRAERWPGFRFRTWTACPLTWGVPPAEGSSAGLSTQCRIYCSLQRELDVGINNNDCGGDLNKWLYWLSVFLLPSTL